MLQTLKVKTCNPISDVSARFTQQLRHWINPVLRTSVGHRNDRSRYIVQSGGWIHLADNLTNTSIDGLKLYIGPILYIYIWLQR